MTPQRWQQIKQVYHAALDAPVEQRSSFVENACASDAALRGEVERLLRQHADGGAFMEIPGAEAGRAPTTQGETLATPPGTPVSRGFSEQHGTRIGHYTLLQPLGEGGCGAVWLADQHEPVRRRVALKLIKLGMDTRQVIARFEAERQALAVMDHPHVAKVFDAGATETGRPYFVMEHVQGVPITEHCDRHNLSVRERLELFIKVCEAVQHAHQKGIIHRDLKPSNILVEFSDSSSAKANPKVIDFGVAKAMTGPLTNATLYTEQGQIIGTPAYMSPEQADLSAQDIDTRSDIYSLGVVLYELLTGTLPLEAGSLRSVGLAEMQRVIREVDPPTPSTRLTRLHNKTADASRAADSPDLAAPRWTESGVAKISIEEIAKRRQCAPASLRKLIRGDLDWITMKALEKDRTRRYASASDLAADICRHLTDEPVMAGPPTARYRCRKFLRRNRTAVHWAGVLICIASIAEVAYSRMAKDRERAVGFERDRALAAEKLAREERDRALAVNELLQSAFLRPIPTYPTSNALYEDFLRRAEAVFGKDDPMVGLTLTGLGAQLSSDRARSQEAATVLQGSVEYSARVFGENDRTLATPYNTLSMLRLLEGSTQGLDYARRVVEIRERSLGPGALETATAREALALQLFTFAYGDHAKYKEIERQYRLAMTTYHRELSADHARTIEAMCGLGQAVKLLGRLDEAQPLLTEALAKAEDNPDVRATIRYTTATQLADLLRMRNDREQMIDVYLKLPGLAAEALGEQSFAYKNNLMVHARELDSMGASEAAEDLRAAAMSPENPPPAKPGDNQQ